MLVGMVGLPLSGKTTLFNALTGSRVQVDHFGGRRETHRAVVQVPDPRLEKLAEIFQPEKVTPATVEYVDTAGVQESARAARGLDDELLGYLRTVDEILLVLRAFRNPNVPHPRGDVDPLRDAEQLQEDLLLSDLAIVEARIARLEKSIPKTHSEAEIFEQQILRRFLQTLEEGKPLRCLSLEPEEKRAIRGYGFLTLKPTMFVLNLDESDMARGPELARSAEALARFPATSVQALCAQIEMEIAQLDPADRKAFLDDLGLEEPAMSRLIRASYDLLGLVTFFTYESREVRAWTIPQGTPARRAAGTIHSDMERGFIRAEVVSYEDLVRCGSIARCRESGALRLEGKDYVVQDGDVITFRFAS
ncbi:MAG: redox-regulated ATPase YchF [candidate division KSB1 bacterium]|nr:redox-regulated ATPase YchF [candidate division KSB1 bacterium]